MMTCLNNCRRILQEYSLSWSASRFVLSQYVSVQKVYRDVVQVTMSTKDIFRRFIWRTQFQRLLCFFKVVLTWSPKLSTLTMHHLHLTPGLPYDFLTMSLLGCFFCFQATGSIGKASYPTMCIQVTPYRSFHPFSFPTLTTFEQTS